LQLQEPIYLISVKFAIVILEEEEELAKDVNKHPELTRRKLQIYSQPILQDS
jgi:hypothetical protein